MTTDSTKLADATTMQHAQAQNPETCGQHGLAWPPERQDGGESCRFALWLEEQVRFAQVRTDASA